MKIPPSLRKNPVLILLLIIYAFHLLGVFGFVSFFEWGSERPLLTDDYAHRSSLFYDTRDFFASSRRLWSYSPYHLSGYPHALTAISAKGEQVLSLVFPFVNPAELLKMYVVTGILIFPLLILSAGRILKLPSPAPVLAAVMAILFFWKYPNVSSVRWGSISYIVACPLALLSLASLLAYLKQHGFRTLFLFWFLGSLSSLFHSVGLLILFPPALMALALAFIRASKKNASLGLVGLAGILIANLFWILPLLWHRSLFNAALAEVSFLEPLSVHGWYFEKDLSRIVLLLLGLLGIGRWSQTRRDLSLPFAAGVFSLFMIMFVLREPPALLLQRFRYDWPLSPMLLSPAASFLAEAGGHMIELIRRKGKETFSLNFQTASPLVLCGIVLLALFTSDLSRYTQCLRQLFTQEKLLPASYPLPTSTTPPELDHLIGWVRRFEGEEGRLLMEDSHHPNHIYWATHLPAILPLWTGREIVSSPLPEMMLGVATIGFVDGELLGKPVATFSPPAFQAYLDRYNIRWLICFSPPAKTYFEGLSRRILRKSAAIGPFFCYEVNRPSNFFLKGSGKVSAGFDRISLKEVKAESGEVVLKYHWFPGVRTVPERKVVAEAIPEDPLGFIKIENPPEAIDILF